MSRDPIILFGGTPYRWVGNMPDPRRLDFPARMQAMIDEDDALGATTPDSWREFLKSAILTDPWPHGGRTVAELKADGMRSVWRPVEIVGAGVLRG